MLIYEDGDIVKGKYDIFCHQVNCQGVMGAGLALQIRRHYPEVYSDYVRVCSTTCALLGTNIYKPTKDSRVCVSMFAQYGHGTGKCYTDYKAFQSCLDSIAREICCIDPDGKETIAFPYRIGCGLAGGDWHIIESMLEDFSNKVKNKVIIVKKN